MEGKKLGDLIIYKQAVECSSIAWDIYKNIPIRLQIHIGNQFLRAIDSIGANIAEGFGRFHFKDSLKFYYNSRGSLFEAKHWLYLLKKRDLIEEKQFNIMMGSLIREGVILNKFINSLKSVSSIHTKTQ